MKIAARLSSYTSSSCPFCDETLDGLHNFVKAAKHLQEVHKLDCMHVGQETSEDVESATRQDTVAIFGSDNLPAEVPTVTKRIVADL